MINLAKGKRRWKLKDENINIDARLNRDNSHDSKRYTNHNEILTPHKHIYIGTKRELMHKDLSFNIR